MTEDGDFEPDFPPMYGRDPTPEEMARIRRKGIKRTVKMPDGRVLEYVE